MSMSVLGVFYHNDCPTHMTEAVVLENGSLSIPHSSGHSYTLPYFFSSSVPFTHGMSLYLDINGRRYLKTRPIASDWFSGTLTIYSMEPL